MSLAGALVTRGYNLGTSASTSIGSCHLKLPTGRTEALGWGFWPASHRQLKLSRGSLPVPPRSRPAIANLALTLRLESRPGEGEYRQAAEETGTRTQGSWNRPGAPDGHYAGHHATDDASASGLDSESDSAGGPGPPPATRVVPGPADRRSGGGGGGGPIQLEWLRLALTVSGGRCRAAVCRPLALQASVRCATGSLRALSVRADRECQWHCDYESRGASSAP
jgi:hypothetical protein